jgi:hypothetical protein
LVNPSLLELLYQLNVFFTHWLVFEFSHVGDVVREVEQRYSVFVFDVELLYEIFEFSVVSEVAAMGTLCDWPFRRLFFI